MKKLFILCCISLLVVSFFSWQIEAAASFNAGKAKGAKDSAPDFTLSGAGGKELSLADIKGHGAIFFFFTTWCPYCVKRMPQLAEEYKTYQDFDIKLVVINAGESKRKVASFLSKHKFPFDIYLDRDTKVSHSYGVVGVPTFVLVSKDLEIVFSGNYLPKKYRRLIKG